LSQYLIFCLNYSLLKPTLLHLKAVYEVKIAVKYIMICYGNSIHVFDIAAPSNNEEAYLCRKGFHALNIQAVANTELWLVVELLNKYILLHNNVRTYAILLILYDMA